MTAVSTQQQLWAEALAESRVQIKDLKKSTSLKIQSPQTLQGSLDFLRDQYRHKWSSRRLNQLTPVFERIQAFSQAINSFVQSDPTCAALVRLLVPLIYHWH